MNNTPYHNFSSSNKLRFDFPDFEDIRCSYSEALQDIFILTCTNGKKNGTFLEIGCRQPTHFNNTYLLSKLFNWYGISIELDDFRAEWADIRPTDMFLCSDALTLDYSELLKNRFGELTNIDYLQLDIDPASNTLKCLEKMPLDTYKFGIITFEHDLYSGPKSVEVKNKSIQILEHYGYELIINNTLVHQSHPYEDWWIHKDVINPEIARKIKNLESSNPIDFLFKEKVNIAQLHIDGNRTGMYPRDICKIIYQ